MFGIWATHRWAWAALAVLWLALTSGLWLAADHDSGVKDWVTNLSEKERERYVPRHLMTDPARLRLWPVCWRLNMPDAERYALWDKLRLHPVHEATIGWEEIAELTAFLRAQGAGDGEVIAWFDSPHAVYLVMDIAPGIRYMHVFTASAISNDPDGKIGRTKVMADLAAATRAKYVISDLQWVADVRREHPRDVLVGPARDPLHLMPAVSPCAHEFPFNQPALFRTRNGTGRYIVHRIVTRTDDPPAVESWWID
jgi:hypothetical protein